MLIRSLVPLLFLAVLALAPARAATAHEQAQLVLILRQLDNIETLAKNRSPRCPNARASAIASITSVCSMTSGACAKGGGTT